MGVLRSVWGLQMYQRAVRGPIEGTSVVRFLLEHDRFPRAVRALLREIRRALAELPDPGRPARRRRPRRGRAARVDGGEHGRRRARRGDGRPAGRHRPARQADHRPLPAGGDRDAPAPRRRRRTRSGAVSAPRSCSTSSSTTTSRSTRRQTEADRLIARVARRAPRPRPARSRTARARPGRTGRGASTRCRSCSTGAVFDELAAGVHRAPRRRWRRCSPTSTGPRQPVQEGWVPAEALASSPRYRLAAVGAPPPPRWLTTLRRRRRRASPTGRGASCRTSPTRRRGSATRCSTAR